MTPLLDVQHLTKRFGALELFSDISFSVGEGQKVGLIAKNGTGKSTLLSILSGTEDSDGGDIIMRRDATVAILEQTPRFNPAMAVIDVCLSRAGELSTLIADYERCLVTEGNPGLDSLIAEMDRREAWNFEQRAKQVLSQLSIENFMQPVGELSGGQLKRVALANVLLADPDLLILDEPTNHLDITSKEILESALNAYEGTVLYVSHDRYFINKTASRILELTHREFINYIGNYDYYLEKKQTPQAAQAEDVHADTPVSAQKLDWKQQKEQQAAQRKKENELKKCEERIALLEEKAQKLDEEMAKPEIATNVARLQEIAKEKAAIEEELNPLYEKWEALSE